MAKTKSPWLQPHLLKLNFCLLSLVLFSSANGYDGTQMNGFQSLTPWQEFFHRPTGSFLGLMNFMYWIGMLVAFLFTPQISNKWGRKIGLWLGVVFVAIGAAIQSCANSTAPFVVARGVIGFGAGFWGSNAPLLIGEMAHPDLRGVAGALYMCGFPVGSSVAAFATLGTLSYENSWSWRIPSILLIMLPCLAIPGLLMIPESPRWLVSQGRTEEATRILVDWHAAGDLSSPLVCEEINAIQVAIAFEDEAANSNGYIDMLRTPGNRHRTFITVTLGLWGNWVGIGVISYYFTLILNSVGITDSRTQLIINACMQVWNILWSVVGAMLIDKLGRRTLFLTSGAIMLVSFSLVTGLSGSFAQTKSAAVGIAVIPFLFLFYAGYDISLTPLMTAYPCEIWPYKLRSRGLTLQWIVGVLGASVNTFVNPIALDAIGWKYYFAYIAILIVYCIVTYLFYPETRGYALEQVAIIFDKDSAVVGEEPEDEKRVTVERAKEILKA